MEALSNCSYPPRPDSHDSRVTSKSSGELPLLYSIFTNCTGINGNGVFCVRRLWCKLICRPSLQQILLVSN